MSSPDTSHFRMLQSLIDMAIRANFGNQDEQIALVAALADMTGAAVHAMAGADAKKLDRALDIASRAIADGAMRRHMRARIVEPDNENGAKS